MSTPLANPRRTKLASWPEPRTVAKESDQTGKPAAAPAPSTPDAERTAR